MKKVKAAAAVLLSALIFAGCAGSATEPVTYVTDDTAVTSVTENTDAEVTTTSETSVTENESEETSLSQTNEDTQSVSEVIYDDDIGTSMNKFAFKLYDEIETDDNLFFSPYSINIALSMLDNGAQNNTESEIERLLGINDISKRNAEIKKLMNSFNDEKAVIDTANSVWVRNGYEFSSRMNDEFLAPLQNFYEASVFNADFDNPGTVNEVNGWISDNTGGMIKKMIDEISRENVMLLINAVYFNGRWTTPFEASSTRESDFNGKNGTTQIQMMNGRLWTKYTETNGMKGIRMPYGNGSVAMDIFIADDNSKQSAVEIFGKMTEQQRLEMFSKLDGAEEKSVTFLSIPKFKFENETIELNDALINLGMTDSFKYPDADFGIINDQIYVSAIKHKAVIQVDELGSKAAAVTVVELKAGGALQENPLTFIADKPFIFTIRDTQTGTILFMGAINNLS